MTDQLVRLRALAMRENGATFRAIADALDISTTTAQRYCKPDFEARQRDVSQAWKDSNREANRARDRQHFHDIKDACPNCGHPKIPRFSGCQGCRDATAAVRRALTEGMWAEGWTTNEIAATLGHSGPGFIPAMRARGWDLPHRYKAWARRAAA